MSTPESAGFINKQLQPLWLAGQFLTRLPMPLDPQSIPSNKAIGRSLLCYPLIGLLIGALLTAVAIGLSPWLPVSVRAALVVSLWVLITGALHLDGLADSADAWIGGQGSRERTLVIMKDPTCGPVAVALVVLLLLLKFTAVEALLLRSQGAWLMLAPVVGRAAILLLFLTTPYVRGGGLAEVLSRDFPRRAAVVTCLLLPLLLLALSVALTFALLLGCGLLFLGLRYGMNKRLGGCTGDTAGGLIEIQEAAVLLLLLAVLPG
ncbi:MAG: adenosylcobinamide-GDP ribazoletransferase [Motiliproteus sp.]